MAETSIGESHNKPEEILCFKFIEWMETNLANKNIYAYFSYFDAAFHMMMNYLPMDVKLELQQEYDLFQEKYYALKENEKNDRTKEIKILELKEDFANKHKMFVYQALQNRGFQKPPIDGEINSKELTPQEMAILVRGPQNLVEKNGD